jgi:hypothetical protein
MSGISSLDALDPYDDKYAARPKPPTKRHRKKKKRNSQASVEAESQVEEAETRKGEVEVKKEYYHLLWFSQCRASVKDLVNHY